MSTGSDRGVLSLEEARRVYNRIGRLQDWQSSYEAPALADLVEHAGFESAASVYEFGCGTGAFARRLLQDHLDRTASYRAVDISETMVRLASERLAPWQARTLITPVEGRLPLPGEDHTFDRFVATYVLELLDDAYARRVLEEVRRLLAPSGTLCVVSLTEGATPASRVSCRGWQWVWSRAPQLVGGCRPVDLLPLLSNGWELLHHRVVTSWAISSEIVVAGAASNNTGPHE